MRAQEGHCDASLSSGMMRRKWSVIVSMIFLHDAQLSCLILCYLLESFLFSVKGPFRGFHFNPENASVFFPISTFQGDKALLHHSFRAGSVITRFQLPLTKYSCLFFFFSLLSEPLYSVFLGKSIATFLARIDLFPSSSKAFHGAPFFQRTVSAANLSVVFLLFAFRDSL